MASPASTDTVVTRQKIGFKGEEWEEILTTQRDAVVEAFRRDTAGALGIAVDGVFDVQVREKNFTMHCSIRHSATLSKADVKRVLTTSPYTEVWKFYFAKRREREATGTAATNGRTGTNGHSATPTAEHRYTMYLRGEYWDSSRPHFDKTVLRAVQLDIKQALLKRRTSSEVSEAVVGETPDVAVTPTKDGITVTYIIPDLCSEAECQERRAVLGRYSYPNAWGEYYTVCNSRERVVTRHRVFLNAPEWNRVLSRARDEVCESFKGDVASILDESDVSHLTFSGSLEITFSVAHAVQRKVRELNQLLRDGDYWRTWNSYKRVTGVAHSGASPLPPPKNSVAAPTDLNDINSDNEELVVSRHRLRFPGDAWTAAVAQLGSRKVSDAITTDVCKALKARRRDVYVTTLKEGSLVADLQLTHLSTQTKASIDAVFAVYAFPATWRLLPGQRDTMGTPPIPLDVAHTSAEYKLTTLRVRLDGADWATVTATDEDKLRNVFCADVTTCFAGLQHVIRDVKFSVGSLRAVLRVEHDFAVTRDQLEGLLMKCDFHNTWSYYEGCVARKLTLMKDNSRHQIVFAGDRWVRAIQEQREPMRKALIHDVAEQLLIPTSNITDIHFESGPRVFFLVKQLPGLTRRTIDERLEKGTFPRMNALCEKVAAPAGPATPDSMQVESLAEADVDAVANAPSSRGTASIVESPISEDTVVSRHRVRFEGPDWKKVLDTHEAEVRSAFVADIEGAIGVPEETVQIVSFELGSLVIICEIAHSPALDRRDIDQKLSMYEYPNTWTVYVDAAPKSADEHDLYTTTHHRVQLDGPLWDVVAEKNSDVLRKAFCNDVAGTLSLSPDDLINVSFSHGSLLVDFDIEHPCDLTPAKIDEGLATCPYKKTWEIYGAHYNSLYTQETRHRVRLEGNHWETVMNRQETELISAFREDVSKATELPIFAVSELELKLGSLIIDFTLRHGEQTRQFYDDKLAQWSFPQTWSLYKSPAEPQSIAPLPTVTTSHRVRLEGDLWSSVIRYQLTALIEAFQSDISLACDLPKENFGDFVFNEDVFRVQFTCDHSPDLTAKDINKALGKSAFLNSFALYPAFATSNSQSFTRIRHNSEQQDEIVATRQLLSETATPLRAHAEQLPVLKTSEETHAEDDLVGLRFRSESDNAEHMTPLRREKLQLQAKESYMSLDGLTNSDSLKVATTNIAGSTPTPERTTHLVQLEGNDWGWVLENYSELLHNEFTKDVSNATSLPQSAVQHLVFALGSLLADFRLEHNGLPQDQLDKQLSRYHFPLTMALHNHLPDHLTPLAPAEKVPALQRVGTPEEAYLAAQHEAAPVAARSVEGQPLRDNESFMSLDPLDEPQRAAAEEAPALRRVGTPVQAKRTRTTHLVQLEGNDWGWVLENYSELLHNEFTKDVSNATSLPQSAVQHLVFALGSLLADFRLEHNGLPQDQLDKQLSRYHFPLTMALHNHLPDHLMPLAPAEKVPALQRVSTPEEARQVPSISGAPPRFMSVAEPYDEGFVRRDMHEDEQPEPVVATEGEAPQLRRTGTLQEPYEVPSSSGAPPRFMSVAEPYDEGFVRRDMHEDEQPEPVVATEGEAPQLRRTGTLQEARQVPSISGAPPRFMSVAEPYDEGFVRRDMHEDEQPEPVVATEGEAPQLRRTGTLQEAQPSDRGGEAAAGALLVSRSSVESRLTPRVTYHEIVLPGHEWYKVINLPELAGAFRVDCAMALDIPPKYIRDIALAAGSLMGSVHVVHSADEWSADETDVKLCNYHFPETWKLYPSFPDPKMVHFFDGGTASAALRNDDSQVCSAQRELPEDDRDLSTSASTHKLPCRPNSAVERSDRNELPIRNRRHSAPIDAPQVPESLPVRDEPVEAREKTPTDVAASAASTAALTPPEFEPLDNVSTVPSVDVSAVQSKVRYTVEDPSLLPDPAAMVNTRHRVGFVGERWPIILKDERDAFTAAFIKGTAAKLGFAPETVDKVQSSSETGDTIVTFHIKHPSSMPSKNIDVMLRTAPYEDVWKLYYGSVNGGEELHAGETTSVHRVGFVGNKWREVIDCDNERFRNAFAVDTAAALNLSPQAVKIADYAVAEDIVVDFYVTHRDTESDAAIDDRLELYDYRRVWELYGIPNEADERSRDVPLVMKRSPASRHLRSHESSTVLDLAETCPTCRRRWSPGHVPLVSHSSHLQVRFTPSYTSSNGDAVQDSLREGSTPLARHTTPPRYKRRLRNGSPATGAEGRTPHLRSGEAEGGSRQWGAQTSPRVPRYADGGHHNSTNTSLVPHPPRQRRLSSATRHRQRRVNLRELEGELSRKERERTYHERQDQLDREMRRSMTLSRTSLSTTSPNTSVSRSFLPSIPARYTKMRPNKNGFMNGVSKTADQ
ncbi:hypothetical protein ABB37_02402 [Leptomonas pyrrhocoris]|uniref:Flagellar attachment zone protein 1 conserved domain-containing protein n=1 Tax=Leptomonas pyrrhocoris TaxID=157538 RepID=A0A0M9G7X4_LEPPY|nr:hypothetical protein ABB37_02402 [Leptomonas pyrrhocoris]KPA84427.1 hypothetical protein ABB37_02402 [Leptomonas pyrrhocoris]|eukprot:XP_015662866.1 hypothetical protein ABB37_02402 [Leptomonas pyrrhocoris]